MAHSRPRVVVSFGENQGPGFGLELLVCSSQFLEHQVCFVGGVSWCGNLKREKNMGVSFVLFPFWGVMDLEVGGEEGLKAFSPNSTIRSR